MVHIQTEEMTLNNEAKKQLSAKMAQSSFCVEAYTITHVPRLPPCA